MYIFTSVQLYKRSAFPMGYLFWGQQSDSAKFTKIENEARNEGETQGVCGEARWAPPHKIFKFFETVQFGALLKQKIIFSHKRHKHEIQEI